jgi:hypothetical protein
VTDAGAGYRAAIDAALAGDAVDPALLFEAFQSHLVQELESGDLTRGLQALRLFLSVSLTMAPPNNVAPIAARIQSVCDQLDAVAPKSKVSTSAQLRGRFQSGFTLIEGDATKPAADRKPKAKNPAPTTKRSKRASG